LLTSGIVGSVLTVKAFLNWNNPPSAAEEAGAVVSLPKG